MQGYNRINGPFKVATTRSEDIKISISSKREKKKNKNKIK
ncbi:hypothetical protein QG37_07346 [Candidozyma auris]|nr:hypothetical protein QG37_07346 [[Candida] auris]